MYFWIAVLVIMGLQQLFEKLKELRANKESGGRLDRDEWDEDDAEVYQQPKPAAETLADFFRTLTQAPDEVVTPPPPPPKPKVEVALAPQPPAPQTTAKTTTSPPVKLTKAEQLALAAIKRGESNLNKGRTHKQRMHASVEHSALGRMLRDPASLRNAYILKEVLEPPIACRENEAPHTK